MGQLSFADVDPLADPTLQETTFVVVDLETTGGRPTGDRHDAITEIGAVKVRAARSSASSRHWSTRVALSLRRSWR